MSKYTCALTGITDPGLSPEDFVAPLGELGAGPVGWTRVTIERRVANPRWNAIQSIKDAQLGDLEQRLRAASVPAEIMNVQYGVAVLTLDATFHALEKDTPPFLTIREEVWIADHADALGAWNEVRESLDLPTIALEDWVETEFDGEADSTPSAVASEPE